jgi:hypothetical protein
MIDDPDVLAKKAAYIDTIRGLYRRERTLGYVGSLVGVLALVWARYAGYAPPWALWVAVAVIAASWALFAYVIFKRTAWVRTHPFDPNG